MILTAIAAIAQNGIIGKDNDLIWHLPDDLKHFKRLTKGHTIIMGRKTWESIGARPLPYRDHIIITRNADYKADGARVVTSIDDALQAIDPADEQPFIVGGAEIYKLAMPYVKQLELTYVHHDFEGDTSFPAIDANSWEETWSERHEKDEKHLYPFTFTRLQRKSQ